MEIQIAPSMTNTSSNAGRMERKDSATISRIASSVITFTSIRSLSKALPIS